jgi:hypothetical protein
MQARKSDFLRREKTTMGEVTKKEWSTPVVTVYGDVQRLTLQTKLKQPGLGDDFQVPGVSDAT